MQVIADRQAIGIVELKIRLDQSEITFGLTLATAGRSRLPFSNAAKKKALSRTIGPPAFTKKESTLCSGFGLDGFRSAGRATKSVRRKMYPPSPCRSLVPDLVRGM